MTQTFSFDTLTMGTCYYPEHWPEEMWPEDIRRMKKAGISVVRVAEFTWSLLEPEEGRFEYGLFDRFLALCEETGMKVILGTPTATPPVWLTEAYPEVLNARNDGVLYRHGGRRHYNYNAEIYRMLSARIVEKMAERWGKHPAVIGWQIDNEINCETDEFYSEADSKAFRRWAKEKYGTLEALNEAWGTVVWSQTISDWNQIHVPRPVINRAVNPHFALDYRRFVSESAISFCRMQAEILRKYRKPGDFITTNGLFDLDNHRLQNECLDIYMYDSYPNFANALGRDPKHAKDLNDRKWSRHLTDTRSVCPHFGIMEQQAGAGSWATRMEGPMPRPGQLKLWALQSTAHGADFVSFFRWRTAVVGTEIYWHGILDYDGRDNRRLAEITEFGEAQKKLAEVCGAENVTAFALLQDYDNRWDARTDVWHARLDEASLPEIFAASQLCHTPYDVVNLTDGTSPEELKRWPVLLYPHPSIVTEERAALLGAYVEAGGTLILGCRSGYKDIHGHCVMEPQPGLFRTLTGTDIREYTFASPAEDEPVLSWEGEEFRAPVFNDVLTPEEDTEVLAVYGSSFYQGEAAVTRKRFGKGCCIHVGTTFTRELVKRLLQETGILEPFADRAAVPADVETVMRERDGRTWLFLLNYTAVPQTCLVKKTARALLAEEAADISAGEEIVLQPYGVEVLGWRE